MALNHQGAEGKRLGGRPVDVLARIEHLSLGVELARDLAIEVEFCRHPRQGLPAPPQRFPRSTRPSAPLAPATPPVTARPRPSHPTVLVRVVYPENGRCGH